MLLPLESEGHPFALKYGKYKTPTFGRLRLQQNKHPVRGQMWGTHWQ